ncbi:MAG: PIN domain-containing protein [Actinomycetes bacterium]
MRYLLDTNAITRAVREPTGSVAQHVDRYRPDVITSVIVEAEIRFGIAKKPDSRVAARVARYLDALDILPFDSDAADHYGDIRADLERNGQPLDAMDTLIAAHARSLASTVITRNIEHFNRVPNLLWANWEQLQPPGLDTVTPWLSGAR